MEVLAKRIHIMWNKNSDHKSLSHTARGSSFEPLLKLKTRYECQLTITLSTTCHVLAFKCMCVRRDGHRALHQIEHFPVVHRTLKNLGLPPLYEDMSVVDEFPRKLRVRLRHERLWTCTPHSQAVPRLGSYDTNSAFITARAYHTQSMEQETSTPLKWSAYSTMVALKANAC